MNNVTAARYNTPDIGYLISFEFPTKPKQCDDARLFDDVRGQEGWVIQGGGDPGAPIAARFPQDTDRAQADIEVPKMLPGLNHIAEMP